MEPVTKPRHTKHELDERCDEFGNLACGNYCVCEQKLGASSHAFFMSANSSAICTDAPEFIASAQEAFNEPIFANNGMMATTVMPPTELMLAAPSRDA